MRVKDIAGQRFGRLIAVSRSGTRSPAHWLCKCDCGAEKVINGAWLRDGTCRSCGCYRSERMVKMNTVHGMKGTSEYAAWSAMVERCHNSKHAAWKNYGGRGIKVCEDWRASFENFYRDVGKKTTRDHTLDRINNDGNYEPSNVRWATYKEQALNRKNCERDELGRWSHWKRN